MRHTLAPSRIQTMPWGAKSDLKVGGQTIGMNDSKLSFGSKFVDHKMAKKQAVGLSCHCCV